MNVGRALLFGYFLASCLLAGGAAAADGFGPAQVAVIVNDADPLSRKIAAYYQVKRQIQAANLVHVRFPPGAVVMSPAEFGRIKSAVDAATPAEVQAYALTWAAPYRVGCMSISTAFAAGYDKAFCSTGCGTTKPVPYFDSGSAAPHRDYALRPTMALAGTNFEEVKKLIDRGVASDGTRPRGRAYLMITSDQARSVRWLSYASIVRDLKNTVDIRVVDGDYIENKEDVLFYFTGVVRVAALDSNRFLPGAIGDHLTSTGGKLTGGKQMSSLRWLEAGATGSYGTVVEPCNHPAKFPDPYIVMRRYLHGETLIEAYWKSVAQPGQGIFIGEPLARPYGPGG